MTTKRQVIDDLGRFAAECPERKVVCLDDSTGAIFFEHTVGDGKVTAFRLGDDVECDTDFMDDVE